MRRRNENESVRSPRRLKSRALILECPMAWRGIALRRRALKSYTFALTLLFFILLNCSLLGFFLLTLIRGRTSNARGRGTDETRRDATRGGRVTFSSRPLRYAPTGAILVWPEFSD